VDSLHYHQAAGNLRSESFTVTQAGGLAGTDVVGVDTPTIAHAVVDIPVPDDPVPRYLRLPVQQNRLLVKRVVTPSQRYRGKISYPLIATGSSGSPGHVVTVDGLIGHRWGRMRVP